MESLKNDVHAHYIYVCAGITWLSCRTSFRISYSNMVQEFCHVAKYIQEELTQKMMQK